MAIEPVVTVRLEVAPGAASLPAETSATGVPHAPPATRSSVAARAAVTEQARETKKATAKSQEKKAKAKSPGLVQSFTQRQITKRGGIVGGLAAGGVGLAARGAAAGGFTGAAGLLAKAAAPVGILAGGVMLLEKLPNLILGAVEGATGLSVPTAVADDIAASIRKGVADIKAGLGSIPAQTARERARIIAGGTLDVIAANEERAAFAEVQSLREQWRGKIAASLDHHIMERLAAQVTGRNTSTGQRETPEAGTSPGVAPSSMIPDPLAKAGPTHSLPGETAWDFAARMIHREHLRRQLKGQ